MGNIIYDIGSRANLQGFKQAETAIDQMTGAQVRWNATANRWQSDSGKFIAANRVTAGSTAALSGGIKGLALGFAGGVGLTVAIAAATAAGAIFRKEIGKGFDLLRHGTTDVKGLRDAVRELSKEGGKGTVFGVDVDELERLQAVLGARAGGLSGATRASGALGQMGFIGNFFFGSSDGKQTLTLAKEAQKIVDDAIKQAEHMSRARAELARAATQSGLALPFAMAFPGMEAPEDLKERTTLLDKELQKRGELQQAYADIVAAGPERLALLEKENRLIEEGNAAILRNALLRAEGRLTIPGFEGLAPEAVSELETNVGRVEVIASRYQAMIAKHQTERDRALNESLASYDQFAAQMNQIVASGFVDIVETAITGSGSVVGVFADFLQAMGRATISTGVIKLLTDWRTLGALGPGGAIAAGAGMIAAAHVLRSQFADAHSNTIGAAAGTNARPSVFVTNSGRFTGAYTDDVSSFGGTRDVSTRLVTVLERLDRNGLRGTLTSERGAFKAELTQQSIRDSVGGDVKFYH